MIKVRAWDGRAISMPGIYSGIPIADYHRGDICVEPSISSTGLRKIFAKSPAHYWQTSPLNPSATDDEQTKAMILGGATHHLLFGQPRFAKHYVVHPVDIGGAKWHGARTVCKAWLNIQKQKKLTVISPADLEKIKGMARSLIRDPAVQEHGALNGLIEHSIFWKDRETGVWLKVRPDAFPASGLDFIDLKKTHSVMWGDLQKSIMEYGYYQQGALVAEACEQVFQRPMQSFNLMFVEDTPPHCVEFVTLKDGDIVRGQQANRAALRIFAKCLKDGVWPGPRGDRVEPKHLEMRVFDQTDIDWRISAESGGGKK